MTATELLVIGFVVAAYGLGWWARGAWRREHDRQSRDRTADLVAQLAGARDEVARAAERHRAGEPPLNLADLDLIAAELKGATADDPRLALELTRVRRAVHLTRTTIARVGVADALAAQELELAQRVASESAHRAAVLASAPRIEPDGSMVHYLRRSVRRR